jgi:hypothetical protein
LGEVFLYIVVFKSHCPNSKALSFHGISFGPVAKPESLRRMAEIAREVQATDPGVPGSLVVESSSAEALETVSFRKNFDCLANLTGCTLC